MVILVVEAASHFVLGENGNRKLCGPSHSDQLGGPVETGTAVLPSSDKTEYQYELVLDLFSDIVICKK